MEALCEVQFLGSRWAFDSPLELFRLLADEYPSEPQRVALPISVVAPEAADGITFSPSTNKIRFANRPGDRFVMIDAGVISVHTTGLYPGWEAFLAAIERAVSAYVSVVGGEEIARIGVRYLNRISLKDGHQELPTLFVGPPRVFSGAGLKLDAFFQRTESTSADRPSVRVLKTMGTVVDEEKKEFVLLDIDVVWQKTQTEESLPLKSLVPRINKLRAIERDVFESSILDRLRERFDD